MDKVDVPTQVIVEKNKVADPAPLGLAAFAATTFLLSIYAAGWAQDLMWLGFAFFYGGLAQFVAGMWEFRRDNSFGAAAFTTYGSYWMGVGLLFTFLQAGLIDSSSFNLPTALGWINITFFIFDFYMTICSLLINPATFSVFFSLGITLLLLSAGNFAENTNVIKAGGYFGVLTCICAWYTSFATCFNNLAGQEVIPVGSPVLKFKGK